MIRQQEFFQTMGIAESKRYHKVYIIRKITDEMKLLADVVAQAVKKYI